MTGPGPEDHEKRRGRCLKALAIGAAMVGLGLVAVALWSVTSEPAEAESQTARRGGGFSAFIEDLPIMPGLTESDAGYAFDLAEGGGRLAEARLAGPADPAAVRGFYAATLAQLGWKATDQEPDVYRRGDERLVFLVQPRSRRPGAGRRLEAVFVITPGEAPREAAAQALPPKTGPVLH